MPRVTRKQTEAQLRAAKKWKSANTERVTFTLYPKDPSKEQIKAAAERDGLSLNAFIVEAIKDKL